ncbi:hypothetical protein [Celerinatantimonas sp. MCCC 1A17872]|uniref:hypothetical protein n=1 Tax=Celerinatantimonas sp. MCCC 1A17872 TaxID=3177514 RepID=UPI0038C9287C
MENDEFYDYPMVCCFDVSPEAIDDLKRSKFNIDQRTLGKIVTGIPNDQAGKSNLIPIDIDIPNNIYEYDIIIVDQSNGTKTNFHNLQNERVINRDKLFFIYCEFPQNQLDLRPLSNYSIQNKLKNLYSKDSILIFFNSNNIDIEYNLFEVSSHTSSITETLQINSKNFYPDIPQSEYKYGKKAKLPDKDTKFSELLSRYIDNLEYYSVFSHPVDWSSQSNGKPSENFVPLLVNEQNQIISFIHCINKTVVFFFPDFKDKDSFILELMNNYLPDILPRLFPQHGQFKWLSNSDYLLPGEKEIFHKKKDIERKYQDDIKALDTELITQRENYKFLHEMISESGSKLVTAISTFLTWLGFDNVVDMDEKAKDIFEEDLQIDTEKGLLVIEIKGIGGTSKDKECSQINKIKYRRSEERNSFDVFGLYIVNHQRYIEPKIRVNPPFTEHQIKDAINEKRGLLTTYDLYKSYFWITEGIITKKYVREMLYNYGLIDLKPNNLFSLGIPSEIYKGGTVAIIKLNNEDNITLYKDSFIVVKRNNELSKVSIKSIKLDNLSVESASSGEIGILLSAPIKKGAELFFLSSDSE